VLKVAEDVPKDPVQSRHLCALITLDVQNYFNFAPWILVDAALKTRDIPTYMMRLKSNMKNRSLIVGGTSSDITSRSVSCGVPQR